MTTRLVALSVKQPWAALLVAGVKSIEVRKWPTKRRGPVLIHASKVPDERPHGWARIATPELAALAELRGGFIGIGDLDGCRTYSTVPDFAAESDLHLNDAAWFVPPRLYGFLFRNVRAIPYHPYTGQTLFFGVEGYAPPDTAEGPH